jgi:hypothetical protein
MMSFGEHVHVVHVCALEVSESGRTRYDVTFYGGCLRNKALGVTVMVVPLVKVSYLILRRLIKVHAYGNQ